MKLKLNGIKKAAEHRRGELVRDLLRLVGSGAMSGAIATAPNTLQLLEFLEPKSRMQRQKIWSALHYLEKHGDIAIKAGEDGKEYVYLTGRGRVRLDGEAIWQLQLAVPRRWDRKWRMVMFDFPAQAKRRHEFRSKLEDLGFAMYQRSVFIYPHECREEVYAVAKWMDLDDHVRYIVAAEIHDMRHFAKLFDLL